MDRWAQNNSLKKGQAFQEMVPQQWDSYMEKKILYLYRNHTENQLKMDHISKTLKLQSF